MTRSYPWLALTVCVVAAPALAADNVTAPTEPPVPTAISIAPDSSAPPRGPRYRATFSYLTSRSASTDFRSFRSSATDDSGAVTEGSALPNMNYFSTRLSVSPWQRHTFSVGDLQSLDSDSHRSIMRPGGGGSFTLPASIWSVRYGYRINDHWNAGLSETYVQGRGYSDPMAGLNFRSNRFEDQGLAHRLGLNLSVPTTEHSHNDRLITRATIRTSLAWAAGPWITSAGIAYSRPIYAHPGNLSATNFDDPNAPPGSPQSLSGRHRGGGPVGAPPRPQPPQPAPSTPPAQPTQPDPTQPGTPPQPTPVDPTPPAQPTPPTPPGPPTPGPSGHDQPVDTSTPTATDPSTYGAANDADYVTREREYDRTTSSIGISFQPSEHWRFGSGAGVTYVETWGQNTIWLTNARAFTAAYNFGKMEVGSDVSLYSDIHKYQHPSLPSLLSIGFHLSYMMGADRQTQL